MRRPLALNALFLISSMLLALFVPAKYAQPQNLLFTGDFESANVPLGETRVGIAGDQLTINDKKTFLLGVSYFDAVHWRGSDLDQLAARKFNLIRIFLDWGWRGKGFFDEDANLTNTEKLLALVRACNQRGIVVDVTIAANSSMPREKAVRNAVRALKNEQNVIFDIQNEHNLEQSTAGNPLSHATVRQLYNAAKAENPQAIVFVSNYAFWMRGNRLKANLLSEEVNTGVDLVAPHFTRNDNWYDDTDIRVAKTKNYLRAIGKNLPVYIQEEHRNGWRGDNFTQAQFIQAAREAKRSGAAAWIFHTDAGFTLKQKSFFAALDATERQVVNELSSVIFP